MQNWFFFLYPLCYFCSLFRHVICSCPVLTPFLPFFCRRNARPVIKHSQLIFRKWTRTHNELYAVEIHTAQFIWRLQNRICSMLRYRPSVFRMEFGAWLVRQTSVNNRKVTNVIMTSINSRDTSYYLHYWLVVRRLTKPPNRTVLQLFAVFRCISLLTSSYITHDTVYSIQYTFTARLIHNESVKKNRIE